MNALNDVIGAFLDYCDRHPFVALILRVGATAAGVLVAIGIATMLIPIFCIAILVVIEYCLPVSIAIFENLKQAFGL